jgi:hypothetical protein
VFLEFQFQFFLNNGQKDKFILNIFSTPQQFFSKIPSDYDYPNLLPQIPQQIKSKLTNEIPLPSTVMI